MIKLKAAELRTSKPSKKDLAKIKRQDIYFILEDVLDTYNTGGIFRLADAIGVKKIFLTGITETPPNTRIKKASINTTEWVTWEYEESALKAIHKLKKEIPNIKIISVEQDEKSLPYTQINYQLPVAFVVGNETNGITKEVLKASDFIAEIPMHGVNTSLNVIISLGIISYTLIGRLGINSN